MSELDSQYSSGLELKFFIYQILGVFLARLHRSYLEMATVYAVFEISQSNLAAVHPSHVSVPL